MGSIDFITDWNFDPLSSPYIDIPLKSPETFFLLAAKLSALRVWLSQHEKSNFLKASHLHALLAMPPFVYQANHILSPVNNITGFLSVITHGKARNVRDLDHIMICAEQAYQTFVLNPNARKTDFSYYPMNTDLDVLMRAGRRFFAVGIMVSLGLSTLFVLMALQQTNAAFKAVSFFAAITMVFNAHILGLAYETQYDIEEDNLSRNTSIYRRDTLPNALPQWNLALQQTNGLSSHINEHFYNQTAQRFVPPKL